MRTTLDIDADVLQAAKELADLHRKTTGQMVSELLRRALQPAAPAPKVRNGIPLLTPRPGMGPITMALVNQLRDDE